MRVIYFAWLRERVGRAEEEITFPGEVTTIEDAIDHLASLDETYVHAFAERTAVRAALDKRVAEHDAPLGDARELAFFPPMTGG